MAWTWSTTTVAWPSGATSALAYPRRGPARPYRPGPASRAAGPEASRHGGPGAVGHQVQQPAALQVDQTGDPSGRRRRVPEERSSRPSRRPPPPSRRAASSTSRLPWSPPPASRSPSHPEVRATAASAWASLPTRRQASARARWVSTALGRIGAARSVQVCTPQAGSRQRQIRLRQASTTGRPPTEQVAHPDRTAAVELGPRPSGPAPDRGGRGLDGEPPLAACDHRRRGPRSRPGRAAWSPTHSCGGPSWGLLSCRRHTSARLCEVSGAVQAAPTSPAAAHRPPLHDDEPLICERVPGSRLHLGL